MKKYLISLFIPYLLFHLSGCYSTQRITTSIPEGHPEMYVKTKDKEYFFEEGDYHISYDTIYGKGEMRVLYNPFKPFKGTISINDVEDIEIISSYNDSDISELLVTTEDKEYIFKSEASSYSVSKDTIYGMGKYRLRYSDSEFEGPVDVNEAEYIEINAYNPGATIALVSILALSVVVIVAMISSFKMDIGGAFSGIGNVHP
ncbi:MAG: hypothetical protein IH618_08190 [Ignavibacteriaceae bacterium]|nr:hypothetical protein [Ignavibacteriaceae bacterium]